MGGDGGDCGCAADPKLNNLLERFSKMFFRYALRGEHESGIPSTSRSATGHRPPTAAEAKSCGNGWVFRFWKASSLGDAFDDERPLRHRGRDAASLDGGERDALSSAVLLRRSVQGRETLHGRDVLCGS